MTERAERGGLAGGFGDASLGDFLAALVCTTVGSPEERLAWAAALMGLPADVVAPVPEKPVGGEGDPFVPPRTGAKGVEPDMPPIRPPTPTETAEAAHVQVPYEIVRVREVEAEGDVPNWLDQAEDLPAPEHEQLLVRPALQTLFAPLTTRALLSTGLATRQPEGDINVAAILEQVTRLRPVAALPREPYATLRLGIQLLIDRGQGTWPFFRDQKRLHTEILGVVGRDRVETLYFADAPLRGLGPRSRRTWRKRYTPPPRGTPVLLLTDLGISGQRSGAFGAPEAEWLEFVAEVRAAECPIVAFVPFGVDRWPPRLRAEMQLVPWSRSTDVSLVRRTVAGRGVAGE